MLYDKYKYYKVIAILRRQYHIILTASWEEIFSPNYKMSWLKPKSVEHYTGMESEQPIGDEMPNFDIRGTVFKELFKGPHSPKMHCASRSACDTKLPKNF